LASSLTVANIDAGYGAVRILHDVSLTVGDGETVALLGTNGNGKSTLMKSIMGMVRPSGGSIRAVIDDTAHELSACRPRRSSILASASCRRGGGCSPSSP